MTKDVLVTIKGIQQDGTGELTRTETVCQGEYYFRNGSHYIFYEESSELSEENTQSTLKLKGNVLELTRKGVTGARMIFEVGKRHTADYATPFGMLQLETDTARILLLEEEDRIRIKAEYNLWANGEQLSECKLTVKLEPV